MRASSARVVPEGEGERNLRAGPGRFARFQRERRRHRDVSIFAGDDDLRRRAGENGEGAGAAEIGGGRPAERRARPDVALDFSFSAKPQTTRPRRRKLAGPLDERLERSLNVALVLGFQLRRAGIAARAAPVPVRRGKLEIEPVDAVKIIGRRCRSARSSRRGFRASARRREARGRSGRHPSVSPAWTPEPASAGRVRSESRWSDRESRGAGYGRPESPAGSFATSRTA